MFRIRGDDQRGGFYQPLGIFRKFVLQSDTDPLSKWRSLTLSLFLKYYKNCFDSIRCIIQDLYSGETEDRTAPSPAAFLAVS
jgi:hypothetical protein